MWPMGTRHHSSSCVQIRLPMKCNHRCLPFMVQMSRNARSHQQRHHMSRRNVYTRLSTARDRPMELKLPTLAFYKETEFDCRLFAKFCQPSLSDNCTDINCANSHEQPSRQKLLSVLQTMQPSAVLDNYYSVVCRSVKLIQLYFGAYSTYFG